MVAYHFDASQDTLRYTYESAKGRMDYNPDVAEREKSVIQKQQFFKTEKEALQAAIKKVKAGSTFCQIWVKFDKGDDDIFRIQNFWLVTDDWRVQKAAEYIGMAFMYDNDRIDRIIYSNTPLDDIVVYE